MAMMNERLTKVDAPEDVGEGGCICEYVPEHLRNEIELIAEKSEAYTASVMVIALQIGLAILISKTIPFGELEAKGGRGEIRQKRGRAKSKLSGAGV